MRVRGPDGSAVPAQLAAATGELASVTFVARVAPLSFTVFDKAAERELLAAPLRLQLFGDEPRKWAAWEIE